MTAKPILDYIFISKPCTWYSLPCVLVERRDLFACRDNRGGQEDPAARTAYEDSVH